MTSFDQGNRILINPGNSRRNTSGTGSDYTGQVGDPVWPGPRNEGENPDDPPAYQAGGDYRIFFSGIVGLDSCQTPLAFPGPDGSRRWTTPNLLGWYTFPAGNIISVTNYPTLLKQYENNENCPEEITPNSTVEGFSITLDDGAGTVQVFFSTTSGPSFMFLGSYTAPLAAGGQVTIANNLAVHAPHNVTGHSGQAILQRRA